MKLDDFVALVWVHGATTALNPRYKYFQGKRRIPAPLTVRRHVGTPLTLHQAADHRSFVQRNRAHWLAAPALCGVVVAA
jgi:hypothetical protein